MFSNTKLYISQIFAAVGCFMPAPVLCWLVDRFCHQTWKPQTQPVARDAEVRCGHVSPAFQFMSWHAIPNFSAKHVPHSKTCENAMSPMMAYASVSRVLAISSRYRAYQQTEWNEMQHSLYSLKQPDKRSTLHRDKPRYIFLLALPGLANDDVNQH